MMGYVNYERRIGFLIPFGKVTETNRRNAIMSSIETNGVEIKCLLDNKEFKSMKEAARYYDISLNTVCNSIKENRPVLSKKQNKKYQFVKI